MAVMAGFLLLAATAAAQATEGANADRSPCTTEPCDSGSGSASEEQAAASRPQSIDDKSSAETAPRAAPPPVPPNRLRLTLDTERPPPRAAVSGRSWYGWQTLLTDALSLGIFSQLTQRPPLLLSLGILALPSPILHWVHGNAAAGFMSLAVRALSICVFYVGGLIGAIAGAAGLVTMIMIDTHILAYKERSPAADSAANASVLPWIDARAGSAGLRFALVL